LRPGARYRHEHPFQFLSSLAQWQNALRYVKMQRRTRRFQRLIIRS
jgi:hypothetical protein